MKVELRSSPVEAGSQVCSRIRSDVEQALQAIVTVKDQFIVNDSLWFRIQKGKATPAVVNSAHFMTSHFTQFLVQNAGWESPKESAVRKSMGIWNFRRIKAPAWIGIRCCIL